MANRSMNRRLFLMRSTQLGVAVASSPMYLSAAASRGDSGKRPNIVLVMADDLGYECIGANGGTSYKTPNLDRLAKNGIRFNHCYSQPLCTPSRVKLMTGKANVRNYKRFGYLDPQETTFAQLLKKAGYATCIAGKWQLNGSRKTNEELLNRPKHFGFDDWCLWQVTTNGRIKIGGERVDGRYIHPMLSINGKLHDRMIGEYAPKVCTDHILDFIEENKDGPFLAYYPMILTHCPFTPTPDSEEWRNPSEMKASRKYKGNPKYFGDMVAYMDKLVGRIVDKLDELGLRENTLVIFTGDNGTDKPIKSLLDGREVAGRKGSMKNGGTHVPLIANWPGVIPSGQVCDDLVDFSDFLPTMCDVADIKIRQGITLDGWSFLPQLKGEEGNPRDAIYIWYSRSGRVKRAQEFARDQRYKLYSNGKFYDIKNDVLEREPLDDSNPDNAARQAKRKLQKVLKKYHDGVES